MFGLDDLLIFFKNVVIGYAYYTLVALVILDVIATAPEAAALGISSLTFGTAAPLALCMVGIFDFGLMLVGFFITVLFEWVIFGKKSFWHSIGLGILAALFLMIPSPVFTLTVLTSKVGLDILLTPLQSKKGMKVPVTKDSKGPSAKGLDVASKVKRKKGTKTPTAKELRVP